jgi:broad specificity phosphatase PhoE
MAKTKDVRLVLIRSGCTDWDRSGRVSGSADHPLCEGGLDGLGDAIQTELASLGTNHLALVLHGPDEASTATAAELTKASKAKARNKVGLAEVGMGLWEGLLPADLEDRYPTVYAKWLEDPTAVSIPEGESIADADTRLRAALVKGLDRISEQEQAVAVILRPIAWMLVRCRLVGRPLSECWDVASEGRMIETLVCSTAALTEAPEGAAARA